MPRSTAAVSDDKGGLAGGQGADDPAGAAHEARHFAWADTTTHASGADDGTAYAGPVSYLQHEYGWSGQGGRAVTSSVANVFVHGGDGDDAIAASGGSNVLDGGLGSNFLVGALGDDRGTDTFFLDGRGQATTWDTLVNFHGGDAVTLWGFVSGTSSYTWSENEGADGYKGATLHAETHGAGTGVNASVTFAGLSVAEAQSKLGLSTGIAGGISYLYVQNHG